MMLSCGTVAALLLVAINLSSINQIQTKKEIPKMVSTACRLRHIHIILRMKNCIPLRIVTRACGGTCASYTTVSGSDPSKLETNCDCCQYVGRRRKYFAVRCFTDNRRRKSIKIASFTLPKECRCRPCSAITNPIVPSEEWIFHTSPILGDLIDSNRVKRSPTSNYTYLIDV